MSTAPPESMMITMSIMQLLLIAGSVLSAFGVVAGFVGNLFIERLKKCETQLVDGGQTFEDIKILLQESKSNRASITEIVAKNEVNISRIEKDLRHSGNNTGNTIGLVYQKMESNAEKTMLLITTLERDVAKIQIRQEDCNNCP